MRDKEGEGGGGGRAKIYLYLNTNFIHQRSRFSAYTMTGRVNKPLVLICISIFSCQFL